LGIGRLEQGTSARHTRRRSPQSSTLRGWSPTRLRVAKATSLRWFSRI